LVQGGNFKDSMKSALMGGFVGGVSAGVKGLASSAEGNMFKKFTSGVKDFGMPSTIGGSGKSLFNTQNPDVKNFGDEFGNIPESESVLKNYYPAPAGQTPQTGLRKYIPDSVENMFYKQGTEGTSGLTLADAKAQVVKEFPSLADQPIALAELAQKAVGQGATKAIAGGIRYLPTAGAALAGSAALGAFDPIPSEPVEDPYDGPSSSEIRLAENPEKYSVGVPDVPYQRASMADIMVRPDFRISDYQKYYAPQYAAAGGEMQDFPRRTGYIGGPGTETSDSIPAMLSDGEFVMNAKAVRGAGGGSRQKGVRKMYDMMRAFEGGAVA